MPPPSNTTPTPKSSPPIIPSNVVNGLEGAELVQREEVEANNASTNVISNAMQEDATKKTTAPDTTSTPDSHGISKGEDAHDTTAVGVPVINIASEESLNAEIAALHRQMRFELPALPGAHAVRGPIANDAVTNNGNHRHGELGGAAAIAGSDIEAGSNRVSTERDSEDNVSGLVEARPVPEGEEGNGASELQHVREAPREVVHEPAMTRPLVAGSLAILLAVTVATVTTVILRNNNSNQSGYSTIKENGVTDAALVDLPLNIFPGYTWDAIMETPSSSQARAYHWLRQDPQVLNYTHDQARQRFALATFYYATSGNYSQTDGDNTDNENSTFSSSWTETANFLSYAHHECEWFFQDQSYSLIGRGMISIPKGASGPCQREPSHFLDYVPYTRLWMAHNGLMGTLPEEIYFLTSLESIDLELQHSPKTVLECWTGSYLHHLAVENFGGPNNALASATDPNTRLHGALSSHIGLLTNLRDLKLSGNHFSGSLPTEVGRLSSTMDLELRTVGNFFSSSIPSELFALSKLRGLHMGLNPHSGRLASELGQVSSLGLLIIAGTQITGKIPSEVGLLTSNFWIDLSHNRLTGSVPSEIALTPLHGLLLDTNQLTGSLPSELGQMHVLGIINGGDNLISGALPSEIGLISGLYSLNLPGNELSSILPSEIGLCTSLDAVMLYDNQIEGTLPSELSRLKKLTDIDLSNNKFSGSIPSEIGLWGVNTTEAMVEDILALSYSFDLSSNAFSGSLASELGQLSLWNISVQDNPSILGAVPSSLCSVASINFDCSSTLCGCACGCLESMGSSNSTALVRSP